MAEMVVKIESSQSSPVVVQNAGSTPASAIYTTLVESAAISAAGAFNHLSIFNPIGSGKTLVVAQFLAFPYAVAAVNVDTNMEVQRTSASSGGTLRAAGDINKFDTTQVDSVAQVRTNNPTVTLVGTVPIIAIPPALTSVSAGVSNSAIIVPPSGALFVCRPGEGIVARQSAAGDADARWSMGFSWAEM